MKLVFIYEIRPITSWAICLQCLVYFSKPQCPCVRVFVSLCVCVACHLCFFLSLFSLYKILTHFQPRSMFYACMFCLIFFSSLFILPLKKKKKCSNAIYTFFFFNISCMLSNILQLYMHLYASASFGNMCIMLDT